MNRFLLRLARVGCVALGLLVFLLRYNQRIGEPGPVDLCARRVADPSGLDLAGWWMPHYSWRSSCVVSLADFDPDVFVNTSEPNTNTNTNTSTHTFKRALDSLPGCAANTHHVLSATCRRDSVRATYQYIPLEPSGPASSAEVAFSALCLVSELQELGLVPRLARLAAVVEVRFGEGTAARARTVTFNCSLTAATAAWQRLDASVALSLDETQPVSSPPTAIVIMLVCSGFDGVVHFADVAIRAPALMPASPATLCSAPSSSATTASSPLVTETIASPAPTHTSISPKWPFAIATHASADRLQTLARLAAVWRGPLSLVVFLPCCTDVSVLRAYARKKLREVGKTGDTALWTVTLAYEPDATDAQTYPINELRNIAATRSSASFVLHIDADFAPAVASEALLQTIGRHLAAHVALVLPAFEVDDDAPLPQNKSHLLAMVDAGTALPFRVRQSPLMHAATDYVRWAAATEPYEIAFMDKYEPYYIVARDGPPFAAAFRGYGSNKAAHALELYAANVTFVVEHDWWLVHRTHAPSRQAQAFIREPAARLATRVQRFEFVVALLRKYGLRQCEGPDGRHAHVKAGLAKDEE